MTGQEIRTAVDGAPVTLAAAAPLTSLRAALDQAGHPLPAGCDQGRCGSCVVLLDGDPVPACVIPAYAAQDRDVATVRTAAHPGLVAALLARGAVQCGYCLPGLVVTLSALLSASEHRGGSEHRGASQPHLADDIQADDVRQALDGHLCRCTGYEAFVSAALDVLSDRDSVSQTTSIRPGSGPPGATRTSEASHSQVLQREVYGSETNVTAEWIQDTIERRWCS